jgi:hypothetical protein
MKGDTVTVEEQRIIALQKGNQVRLRNAQLKRSLKTLTPAESRKAAVQVITNLQAHEGAERMRVVQFLEAIRHAGPSSVNRWLNRAGISPTRRFQDCTHRQLQALADEVLASASRMD